MLIPRYSLRALLIAVTLLTTFFLVVGRAVQGQRWALGLTIGIASVLWVLAVHAGLFLMAWLWDNGRSLWRPQSRPEPETIGAELPSIATSTFED